MRDSLLSTASGLVGVDKFAPVLVSTRRKPATLRPHASAPTLTTVIHVTRGRETRHYVVEARLCTKEYMISLITIRSCAGTLEETSGSHSTSMTPPSCILMSWQQDGSLLGVSGSSWRQTLLSCILWMYRQRRCARTASFSIPLDNARRGRREKVIFSSNDDPEQVVVLEHTTSPSNTTSDPWRMSRHSHTVRTKFTVRTVNLPSIQSRPAEDTILWKRVCSPRYRKIPQVATLTKARHADQGITLFEVILNRFSATAECLCERPADYQIVRWTTSSNLIFPSSYTRSPPSSRWTVTKDAVDSLT